ncbi:MAG TPA: TetR/AcrR family transcriptional regulator [Microlunatus sp.]|nr:TetR/AcrR family transcriptional regulator [Microlunatus sp.]
MAPSTRRSAGPRRRLGEDERRRQIMAAAIGEVAQHGYESATLTRIAARADVAKGLVWRYFSGKDELMAAAARSTLEAMRQRIADALDLTRPVPEIIRAALRLAALQVRTHPEELRALNRIWHNLRPEDGVGITGFYEETYAQQEALFRRGRDEGSLGDLDPRVVAVTYQGTIDAMVAYLEDHPETDPVVHADVVAEILLGGLRRRA